VNGRDARLVVLAALLALLAGAIACLFVVLLAVDTLG
jgi:hypothetical protein